MSDTPEEPALPPSLRLLKTLVIILTITMIAGVITVVGLLVTRMPRLGAPPGPSSATPTPAALPPELTLPAGTRAAAVTMGQGWIGVVTDDGCVLIFLPDGQLHQELRLAPLPEAD